MSDIEPSPFAAFSLSLSFSLAFNKSSIPIRLAVLPRSKFEANFVARLMSSGRLVALPLPSTSFGSSRFKRGGRLNPFSLIEGTDGEAVPLDARAPPFSR